MLFQLKNLGLSLFTEQIKKMNQEKVQNAPNLSWASGFDAKARFAEVWEVLFWYCHAEQTKISPS